ncbi:Hypothetical protein CINCED_3A025719 [Cinara cedri]|uniref:WD repeat-containing protein 55 homolog n=1 Tax=Cinara cedri TaxID=506608 RepID=A0A5E4MPR5_9HEMI|nr:Hypothetical protein CINCED_3A025719 [Cinara cedri]
MCLPEVQKPTEHLIISDEEVEPVDQNDVIQEISDDESSSDSSIDLNSWNSDGENSDDDISMSDDSNNEDNLYNGQENSTDDEVQEVIYVDDSDTNDDEDDDENDDDDDDEEEEEEEEDNENDDEEQEEVDEVVDAFIRASSERNRNHPPNLSIDDSLIGGLSFHPKLNVIALGLSNGDITMYKYSNAKNRHLRTNDNVHLKKIMLLEFNDTGDYLYSACRDNNVSVSDTETGKMKVYFEKAHSFGSFVTSFSSIDENIFATGDEDGVINVWDIRANGCKFSLKKTEDSINSMIAVNNSNNQPTLACASSDGTLSIIDISSKKMVIQSEPYKSLLTSCVTMKQKTKLVCGTGVGSLITFNAGDYNMFNDEFPCVDKNAAVNRLVPVTENIVISALDNGKIRATNLFPNCHLGIVGHHQEMSVDLLDISNNGHLIASTSYFSNTVKFWNIEFFENFDVKKHFKKIDPKEFNLPSSNVVNATDFFSGLQ